MVNLGWLMTLLYSTSRWPCAFAIISSCKVCVSPRGMAELFSFELIGFGTFSAAFVVATPFFRQGDFICFANLISRDKVSVEVQVSRYNSI